MQTEFAAPWGFTMLRGHERAVYQILACKLRDKEPTNSLHLNAIAKETGLAKIVVARALTKLTHCGYVFECPFADNVFTVRPLSIPVERPITVEEIKQEGPFSIWYDREGVLFPAKIYWEEKANPGTEIRIEGIEQDIKENISWAALMYCMERNLPVVL